MQNYFILAQADCTAKALAVWLQLFGRKPCGEHVEKSASKLAIYESCAAAIRKVLQDEESLVILIDTVDVGHLNPCEPGGWHAAVGMLILAFPEIRWLIGIPGHTESLDANEKIVLTTLHGLKALWNEPFDPLYDASGLRQMVRRRTRTEGKELLKDTYRSSLACVLDEESAYAHFHAYTAYRFGFRAITVETEQLAKAILGKPEDRVVAWPKNPDLALEDLFLSYPDQNVSAHWSSLLKRQEELPVLAAAPLRVFITTNQRHGTPEKRMENRSERERLRREGRLGTLVHKPIAGIFDLWRACGLSRKFKKNHGYVNAFRWPPPMRPEKNEPIRHSAPGVLLVIADGLIARANDLAETVNSAKEAIRGAVLATDALELLADQTPTTALEALSLKHRFEVMAECQFYGVQSHLDVEARVKEIGREIEAIGKYFHPSNSRFACWNAEVMILGDLIKIFDEHGQFDESMVLQIRARDIHRRLWARRYMKVFGDELRWINPFYWLAAYTHTLLRSIPVFCAMLLMWVMGLSALYYSCTKKAPDKAKVAIESAVISFFSVGTPPGEEPQPTPVSAPAVGATLPSAVPSPSSTASPANSPTPVPAATSKQKLDPNLRQAKKHLAELKNWEYGMHAVARDRSLRLVECLSVVAGFFHLGIFISHLYSIAARK